VTARTIFRPRGPSLPPFADLRRQLAPRSTPRVRPAGAASHLDLFAQPGRCFASSYAFGRGKTNFWTAASLGHTATGFWPRIWIIVVIAFGLSPTSLKAMGPLYCMSPPV